MTAAPVSDLPAPDSPTTPSTSPAAMSKETSSTAVSVARRVGNATVRLRTERTGSLTAYGLAAMNFMCTWFSGDTWMSNSRFMA